MINSISSVANSKTFYCISFLTLTLIPFKNFIYIREKIKYILIKISWEKKIYIYAFSYYVYNS